MKNGNSHMYAGMFVPPPPQPTIQKFNEFRQLLPAFKNRAEIIKTINNHQVTLVTGGTGCGKTTRKFILK